jgi:hypothetical protein
LTPVGALAAAVVEDALWRAGLASKADGVRAFLAGKSDRPTTADLLQWARAALDETAGGKGQDATTAAARRRLDALAALLRLDTTASSSSLASAWLPDAAPPPPSPRAVTAVGDGGAASALPAAHSPLADLLLRVAAAASAARLECLPDARFKALFEYPLAECAVRGGGGGQQAPTPGAVRSHLSAHAGALLPPRRWADALAAPHYWRHAAVALTGGGVGTGGGESGGNSSSNNTSGPASLRRQRNRARQRRALAALSDFDAERALAAVEARRLALASVGADAAPAPSFSAPNGAGALFAAAAKALAGAGSTSAGAGARLLHPACAAELEAALSPAASEAWRAVAALRAAEAVTALLGVADDVGVPSSSPLLAVAMAQRLTGRVGGGSALLVDGGGPSAAAASSDDDDTAASASATSAATFADPALEAQLKAAVPKLAEQLASTLTPAQMAAPGGSPSGAFGAAEAWLAKEAPALRTWRQQAASAGGSSVAVLCTLTRDEVAALSKEQAAAVRARVARIDAAWEASVEPRLRRAAGATTGAAACALPWASSSSSEEADAGDAAVDALAWRLHKVMAPSSSRPDAALEAAERAGLSLALRAAAGAARLRASAAAADASAVDSMVVAFSLERELARLDPTIAPRPGPLMSTTGRDGGPGPIDRLLSDAASAVGLADVPLSLVQQGGGGGSFEAGGSSTSSTLGDLLSSWLRSGGGGGGGGAAADALLSAGPVSASAAEAVEAAAALTLSPGAAAALSPQLRSELGAIVAAGPEQDAEALRARVRAFVSALDAEVAALGGGAGAPRKGAKGGRRGGGSSEAADPSSADEPVSNLRQRGAAASLAPDALSGGALLPGSAPRGLAELLGEREARQVEALVLAAGGGGGGQGRGRSSSGGASSSSSASSSIASWQQDQQQQPFEMLESVHADIEAQRLLAVEMDPRLDMDLLHPPRPAADPALSSPAAAAVTGAAGGGAEEENQTGASAAERAFLDGMRPLLDGWLLSQGERPLRDVEWRVYARAALLEHANDRGAHEAAHAALGGSGLRSAAADEAVLRARLDAGLPKGSPMRASAHKYLAAACRNRTWTFAQRRRLVDRLVEVAEHLRAHPPAARGARGARGSPFSALFEEGGPPLAPRLAASVGRGEEGAGGVLHGKVAALLEPGLGPGARRRSKQKKAADGAA